MASGARSPRARYVESTSGADRTHPDMVGAHAARQWRATAMRGLLARGDSRRLPGHELDAHRALDPDGGEAEWHRPVLTTRGDLVHRGAGDDGQAAVRAGLHVGVRRHPPVLHAAGAHALDVARLAVGGG